MIHSFTKLLLLIYGLSITGNGLMDLGHEVLHEVKNNIHQHEHSDHHHIHDHTVFLKTNTAPSDSHTESSSQINSYFLFFEQSLSLMQELKTHETISRGEFITKIHYGYGAPLVPPPLPFS